MRGCISLTGAALQEGHPDLLHLSVLCQEAVSAEQPQDGPPHVLAGQGVDDGVEKGVEHGDAQEVVCLEEYVAGFGFAEEVQQEEDEEGQPTGDEDPQDYGDGLQQGHVLLGLAVEAFALGNRSEALGVSLDDAEDSDIEHHDGHEDGAEDGDAEEDVALGVERQDRGAVIQLSHAVPAQDRKDAQQHRQHPARSDQSEHPALFVPLIRLHPHHGDMALDGDGQKTDDRGGQHDEHTPLPEEPQHRGHVQRVGTRHDDVHHVGEACEQVRQSQVAQQIVHGQMELLVLPYGQEHHSVLYHDEQADQQECYGLWFKSILVLVLLQLASEVVVLDDDRVALVLTKHPKQVSCGGGHGHGRRGSSGVGSVVGPCVHFFFSPSRSRKILFFFPFQILN